MEILCPEPTPRRFGIVIPTFGRPSYLRRTLASLAQSDLSNSVVCLVDETRAEPFGETIEGFTGFFNLDSPGGDLGSLEGGLDQIAAAARDNSDCLAFNSCGWLKHRLAFFPRRAPSVKLYVRDDYLARYPRVGRRLARKAEGQADPEAEAVVREFDLPRVPVVKIFKRHHGNMFESFRVGFDLLLERFGCSYLVTLDSDTLVKPDWLRCLGQLHQRFERPDRPLLVSGFHTRAHQSLEKGADYRIKGSLGGINLLFSGRLYQELVRKTLQSLQWDLVLGRRMTQLGGLMVVSRPSVVQHLGRHGVWSHALRFDRAPDF